MSHTGYPPYPQAQKPYAQQHGGPPYPSNINPTGQPSVSPSSLGFRYDAPIYMPVPGAPYPYAPAYPTSAPGYPQSATYGGGSPSHSNTSYPPAAPSHPPAGGNPSYPSTKPYPPSTHNYPAGGSPSHSTTSYPPNKNSYQSSAPSNYSTAAPYPPYSANSSSHSTPSYPPTSAPSNYPSEGPYPPRPSGGSSHSPHHNAAKPARSSSSSYAKTVPYPDYSGSSHPIPTYPNASSHYPKAPTHGTAPHRTTAPHPKTTPHHPGSQSFSYSSGPYPTNTPYGSPSVEHVVERKKTPTVIPAHPFDPRADAETLRKAMKGFGTDEKAIIHVLSRRSNPQRLQIAVEFKTLYGKDLVKDLKSETSGKFEDLLVALMTPLPQYYARELNDAIRGLGTDEDVLIEVLCSKSNNEIRTISAAYQSMFGRTLEQDLKGDTSGTFKRLMVSLCNACRDESMTTNRAAAAEDARQLLQAGELRLGTDESTFNMVLCQRNFAQLRLIFDEYYKITGHDFENAIKNEFSGNSKDGLLAIVRSIRNQPVFFAKCLHGAIAGFGTNDRTLIRVVVTRCEIDMGEIKTNYLAQYGETLADAIKGDTSGDYKKCLLALIGES